MFRFLLAFVFPLLFTTNAQAQVWQDVNTWSPTWELEYQKWVRANWQIDFYSRKKLPTGEANPFYGLRADCADVVYSMRIIFSYLHSLPFASNDPTGGPKLITNRMSRFNQIASQSERMRAFMRLMFGLASTTSMPKDTFPVAISSEWIRPGTIILTTKKNHHSWSIKDILPIGVPWLVYNSVVSSTSSLVLQQRKSWPNPFWVYEGNQTPAGNAGFRKFRPLEYLQSPVWEVPGYSEEQYRTPLNQWTKLSTTRLATHQEQDEALMQRLLGVACEEATGRVPAVNDGILNLRATTGCYDQATFDNYSTPSRDERVFDALAALRVAYREVRARNGGAELLPQTVSQLNKIYPMIAKTAKAETAAMRAQSVNENSLCPVTYAAGKTIDLAEVKRRFFAGLTSNNPLDDIGVRWGEKRGPSPRAAACPSWDSWSPNLGRAN